MVKIHRMDINYSTVSSEQEREKETEKVIEKYEVLLRYLAFHYVRDSGIVEDVMQEVHIKIWLNIDSIKHKPQLKSWLYATTINQCIDYIRSKHYKTKLISVELDELSYNVSSPVESRVIINFEKKVLYQHIAKLPKRYKEPIELFYYKDCNYKEISLLLNINISTVKSRLFRGKNLLKELISDNHIFDTF